MNTADLNSNFPVDLVRSQFPAIGNSETVYFDNPAGTQLPNQVFRAMQKAGVDATANLGGAFARSIAAGEELARAEQRAAAFLGANDPEEIVFGPSMTELTFQMSRAIARTLSPGDEIVLTNQEHEGNFSPWLLAAKDFGLVIRRVEVDPESWRVEPSALEEQLSNKTKVVALNYASNLTGSINDVHALTKSAKSVGALVYIDAVQFAPHDIVDVKSIGCDFLVCSAYKFYGPHLGVLWGRKNVLNDLPADCVACTVQHPNAKFERGTPQYELHASLNGCLDYFEDLGQLLRPETNGTAAIHAALEAAKLHEDTLCERLVSGLKDIPGVSIFGISDPSKMKFRVPTVSLISSTVPHKVLAAQLASAGVNVWHGHNYAIRILEQFGHDQNNGVCRFGIGHYNSANDVDRAITAVAAAHDKSQAVA